MNTRKERALSRKKKRFFRLVGLTSLALLSLGAVSPLSHTLLGETPVVEAETLNAEHRLQWTVNVADYAESTTADNTGFNVVTYRGQTVTATFSIVNETDGQIDSSYFYQALPIIMSDSPTYIEDTNFTVTYDQEFGVAGNATVDNPFTGTMTWTIPETGTDFFHSYSEDDKSGAVGSVVLVHIISGPSDSTGQALVAYDYVTVYGDNYRYEPNLNEEAVTSELDNIYVVKKDSSGNVTLTDEDKEAIIALFLKNYQLYDDATKSFISGLPDGATVTVADDGKITVTYKDGTTDSDYYILLDYYLVPDAPVIETDLTDLAGTTTPVTLALTNVLQAATVYLYDTDGNIIGSAEVEAGATSVTITPTTAIPAGNVTARVIYNDYLDDSYTTTDNGLTQTITDRSLYYSAYSNTVVATSPATDDSTDSSSDNTDSSTDNSETTDSTDSTTESTSASSSTTTDSSSATTASSSTADTATSTSAAASETPTSATTSTKEVVLPNTGEQTSLIALVTGLLLAGGGILLLTRRKKDGE